MLGSLIIIVIVVIIIIILTISVMLLLLSLNDNKWDFEICFNYSSIAMFFNATDVQTRFNLKFLL